MSDARLNTLIPRMLLIGFLVIAILHFVTTIASLSYPGSTLANLSPKFDLDQEYNVPTYYSGIILLSIGLAAWKLRKKASLVSRKYFWVFLSVFFTYWALDEMFVLHEQTAAPLRDLFSIGSESLYYHAWVMIAMPIIAIIGVVLLFIYHQKKRPITKQQLGLLSLIFFYMAGIVALETAGTQVYSNDNIYRLVAVPAEELFELGVASLILAWLIKLYVSKPS
jgi:hypothetical protein